MDSIIDTTCEVITPNPRLPKCGSSHDGKNLYCKMCQDLTYVLNTGYISFEELQNNVFEKMKEFQEKEIYRAMGVPVESPNGR